MILDAVIWLFYTLIKAMLGILPSMELLPDAWETAWDWVATRIAYVLDVMPASDTLVTVGVIIITFEIAMFSFWLIDKVYTWIRG